jgi:hypothetical protein
VSPDGLLAELKIPPEAVRRAYKQWLAVWAVADVAVFTGVGAEWRRWPLAFAAAGVGVIVLAALATAAVRYRRLSVRLTADGIEIDGVLRRRQIAWVDVSWAGWLVIPQVAAYGRDILCPVFRTSVTPLPVVVWVPQESIARCSHEPAVTTMQRFERGYAALGVPYMGRIPRIWPYLYSWLAAMCVTVVAIALYLLVHS